MAKRKRIINPCGCNLGEEVFFTVTRSEFMTEDGRVLSFVEVACRVCHENSVGISLDDSISKWNKEHPLPKRRTKRA